jgi:hypothetical protein
VPTGVLKNFATEKSVEKRVVGGMAIANERATVGSRESKASTIYHYVSTILTLTNDESLPHHIIPDNPSCINFFGF